RLQRSCLLRTSALRASSYCWRGATWPRLISRSKTGGIRSAGRNLLPRRPAHSSIAASAGWTTARGRHARSHCHALLDGLAPLGAEFRSFTLPSSGPFSTDREAKTRAQGECYECSPHEMAESPRVRLHDKGSRLLQRR